MSNSVSAPSTLKRRGKAFPIAVALGLSLATHVAAESPALNAANALIDEARRCSDSSAEKFAKVAGETAETIAAAAFDKCLELWSTATSELNKANRPEFPRKIIESTQDY
jgi:hypothetical protein